MGRLIEGYKEIISLMWTKKRNLMLMLLFDALMLTSFYFINGFFANFLRQTFSDPSSLSTLWRIGALSLLLLSLATMISIYSFFKYCSLDSLRNYFKEEEFTFAHLPHFVYVNIFLGIIGFMIVTLFQMIYLPLAPGKPSLLIAIFAFVILCILCTTFFWYVQLTHCLFLKKKKCSKEIFLDAWGMMLSQINPLSLLILMSIGTYLLFLCVFAIIGLPFKYLYFTTPERIMSHYPIYTTVFSALTVVLWYLLFQANRIHLMKISLAKPLKQTI